MEESIHLISVVVPCYKQAEFMDEAFESLMQQSYPHWECLMVNDGSPDNTEEIAKRWEKKDSRFKYLLKANGGLASARNYGIARCAGEFVVALDSDDKLVESYLEKSLAILQKNPKAGAVTTHLQCFGASDFVWKPEGGNIVSFLSANQAAAGSMFRKKIWDEIGGYDESERTGFEDWDFWIMMCAKGWVIDCIPECLFLYRRKEGSMLDVSMMNYDKILQFYIDKHKPLYQQYLGDVIIYKNQQVLNLQDKLIYHERLLKNLEKSFFFKALRYLLHKMGRL